MPRMGTDFPVTTFGYREENLTGFCNVNTVFGSNIERELRGNSRAISWTFGAGAKWDDGSKKIIPFLQHTFTTLLAACSATACHMCVFLARGQLVGLRIPYDQSTGLCEFVDTIFDRLDETLHVIHSWWLRNRLTVKARKAGLVIVTRNLSWTPTCHLSYQGCQSSWYK